MNKFIVMYSKYDPENDLLTSRPIGIEYSSNEDLERDLQSAAEHAFAVHEDNNEVYLFPFCGFQLDVCILYGIYDCANSSPYSYKAPRIFTLDEYFNHVNRC